MKISASAHKICENFRPISTSAHKISAAANKLTGYGGICAITSMFLQQILWLSRTFQSSETPSPLAPNDKTSKMMDCVG